MTYLSEIDINRKICHICKIMTEEERDMNELKTKITEGGRIIIPAKLRKLFNLKIGEEVILRPMEDSILLVNKKQATKIMQTICKKHTGDGSLADELIADRRKEKE